MFFPHEVAFVNYFEDPDTKLARFDTGIRADALVATVQSPNTEILGAGFTPLPLFAVSENTWNVWVPRRQYEFVRRVFNAQAARTLVGPLRRPLSARRVVDIVQFPTPGVYNPFGREVEFKGLFENRPVNFIEAISIYRDYVRFVKKFKTTEL